MKRHDIKRITLSETDSTNSHAKRLIAEGLECEAIITARHQTGGRGRQGKDFFSPADTGLYMSVVLRPSADLAEFTLITAVASVAVAQSIEKLTGLSPSIKWVNDIYVDGKKVCGILCESVFGNAGLDAVIVGIGINLSTRSFPTALTEKAGSINFEGDKELFVDEIKSRLFELCDKLPQKDFLEYYRLHSCVIGRDITFTENGEENPAHALSIDDGGRLLVRLQNGDTKLLYGGEISVRT